MPQSQTPVDYGSTPRTDPGVLAESPGPVSLQESPVIEVTKNAKPDEVAQSPETGQLKYYLRVFRYTDPGSWILNAVCFVCMVGSGTALPLMDIVFGKFVTVFNDFAVGRISSDTYRAEVYGYTLFFIYLFIGKFVLTYLWTFLIATTAIRTVKAMRIDFLRQTLRQEIAFFDSPSASSISGQVTTNGNLINNGISEKLGLVVHACAMFFAAFIVAFTVHWKLTLIIIGIVPVNLIVTTTCVIFDTMYEYEMLEIFANASALAEETFASMKNVHAFWAFPKLSTKFETILEQGRVIGMKKSPIYVVLFSVEFFLIYVGYALAFWRGIRMYADGEIQDTGTIVTVIFAVVVAAQALTMIAPQTIQITKAAAAAQELFQTIDRKSEIDALSEDGIVPSEFTGDIRLSAVQFAYPTWPNVPVLKRLDLSIPAKKTTALVGASGSGKSTVVGLIERWYSASSGAITLDGIGIQNLNTRWLRTNIRLVQQEPTLFQGTIFQNVAYGLAGTPMADLPEGDKAMLVEEACKAAFAHDFITQLPGGYNTKIGEGGASMSGGQKQRIVIARSIISKPRVLLLDEATSALDPQAEKIVQRALNNVAVGRTMLVIAHRLSTIRDADNIVLMSQGQAIEQGTHDELMSRNGAYARLVHMQDLGKPSDSSDPSGELDKNNGQGDAITQKMSVTSADADRRNSGGDDAGDDGINYSLLKCLYLIVLEQKSLWIWFALLVVGSVAGGATYPAVAILYAEVMKVFAMEGDAATSRGDFLALMFFVIALGQIAAYALLGLVANYIAQVILKAYRQETFDNMMHQEMSFFDEPGNAAGALVSRLSSDPTNVQDLLSMNLVLMFINIVNVVSSGILAIAIGWKLGLVLVFGALPPLVFSGYLRIRLEFALENDTASRFADSSGLAAEAVRSVRTVSSLALENVIIGRYVDALKGLARRSIRSLVWRMFWFSLSQSISFLSMALGFWYGGHLISTGEYTVSQFYIVFIAVIFSGEACALFFQYTTSITKARVSINYIFKLRRLRQRTEVEGGEDGGDGDLKKADGNLGLTCDGLQFAYPRRPNIRVIRGVSTEIKPGQFAAFVGASGCGKTTMISLIERFYNPTSGSIRLGGRPIHSLDRQAYRRQLALVQQEPVLYQGSIRENVALGLEEREPADEEVITACQQANIYDFVVSLPEGLDTACGNQGLQLSGGQRQRIAIARALIRKPKLLLLDEATSALDAESESVVKEALDSAAQGRTTISVAHRLSTIKDADVIFVFSNGKVVECGKHDQLLHEKGVYYEMCLGQSLERSI